MTEARRPRPRVGVAIIDKDHILLIENRQANGRVLWMVPGGGLEWGEALDEAAVRECQEEIRLPVTVGDVIAVMDSHNGTPGDERHNVHVVFHATSWDGEPSIGEDPDVDGIHWVPLTKLPELDLWPPAAQHLIDFADGHTGRLPYRGKAWHDVF